MQETTLNRFSRCPRSGHEIPTRKRIRKKGTNAPYLTPVASRRGHTAPEVVPERKCWQTNGKCVDEQRARSSYAAAAASSWTVTYLCAHVCVCVFVCVVGDMFGFIIPLRTRSVNPKRSVPDYKTLTCADRGHASTVGSDLARSCAFYSASMLLHLSVSTFWMGLLFRGVS